ncbi:ABC transporter ATP-binding protein [Clostridium algidicarnis]|uniref:ABC transporter ATP-binding protein n=1 Tax=Clostridium algidicarnis TaxID=37659 RepID=UPI001C0B4D63|nr:ABC transporter ATP-binding protein [Clostridium algidicarnis]MBU3193327.1 ABC transporter ATP-binding protein/permease [Clostridium algidicarnis]MBU3204680.1 ABC transporter ATP-binding protein/permease [Clostridium algidicarnis]MBU3212835.1 ABC transporter ATP-binding protein/permease [Clostridium algidicarnis]MBU3223479.1 ABC transporter ATP-binding protein/permease [Clostridium algidicarnis]
MMEDRQKRHKTQAKGPMGGGPAMGRPVEKAKDFKGTMKRLITYLRPRRVSLIVVFIFAILSTVFSIVSPKVMGKATTKLFEGIMGKMALEKLLPQLDTLTKLSKNPATATPDVANSISAVNKKISEIMSLNGGKIDFDYIAHIVFILIGLYAISAIFAYVQQYVMAGVAQKTVFNMRKDVDEKLSRLPLKYFDSHTHGEILSRVTNDIDTVSSTLQQSLTQLITSVVTIIGIIVMMLTISPILTLVTIVTLPLSIFVTTNIAKRSQKYFADQQNALGRLNGHVEEMYTGHKIVKAFGHEHKSIGEFNYINEELYNVGWKAQFISGIIMPLMNFINNIGYVLVCVVGGIFVTKGRINLGDIQAFIQYSRQFGQPIVQTANIVNILQSTVAAAERVFEVLDEVEEIQDADITQVIESPKGEVKFENVNFGYEKDAMLIENMNIDVKPGQTIAIVGPTGAGKTTIVNLLMRFYEIDEGKITIDGIDIRDLKRGDLRNIFGMVLQDTWLFNGTIRDNIGYGRLGATEDEIILAAKAAHADHFIRTLPEGYDTILNEEASNISQGQKQLLTIARAILLDPSVLILDEATSSVDTRTEIYIQKAMTKLMQGRTSFVIAHRLSTIRDADLILVMNNGSIIEKGSHEELLEENGFYADLYNSQFKGARLEENAM